MEPPKSCVPAMVIAHSHACHRDMRGVGEPRGHRAGIIGAFWSLPEAMYRLSDRLDPQRMYQVALLCYRAMRAAEFQAWAEHINLPKRAVS